MKIALISDTHLAAVAEDFRDNAKAACAWVDGSGADLAVHLGDITADGVLDPEQLETARATLAVLKTPLRLLPGNHDIGDNLGDTGSGHEPVVGAVSLQHYHSVFGPDRWWFKTGAWTVIGLDAQLFGKPTEAGTCQFEWLRRVVRRAEGPIGLMLHKPLFRVAPDDGETHHRYVPPRARPRLFGLFERRDLRFVVSGHTHQTRRLIHRGIEHVWAPSTAFTIPDRMQETIGQKRVGVMMLTLDTDSHGFEFVSPPGVRPLDLGDYANVYPRIADHH